MKKPIHLLALALCTMILLCSCDKKTDIGLSTKHVEFHCEADTAVITTKVSGWNVENVIVDDESYAFSSTKVGTNGKTFDWLTVAVADKSITLMAAENPLATERTFSITVKDDICSEQITGLQDAMKDGDKKTDEDNRDEELDGIWKNVIQANPTELTLKAEGETARITTRSFWWICTITVDGKEYHSTDSEYSECVEEKKFDKTVDWLTVLRDGNDIVVTAAPNETGAERTFSINLGEGDYYCTVTGIQQAQ